MEGERTPPERIRITGLQEAQLAALLDIEQASAAMYRDLGVDEAGWPARTVTEIIALTRDHDVLVAEADHQVAGYLAWRDEPPGVAFITQLAVHPDYQRFGVGARLLEALLEAALRCGLHHAAGRLRERAPWALGFSRRAGFRPLGEEAPEPVRRWRDEREASGESPLIRPGEILVWLPITALVSETDEAGDEPVGDDAPTPDMVSGS